MTMLLREVMTRAVAEGLLAVESVVEYLLASVLFEAERRPILEAGITAYVRGESIGSIHILTPQIERALRRLAMLQGAPLYTQRRGGGLNLRTLDDLLRDESVGAVLGTSAVTYLRVLLTDARGWNLRNDVCHGICSVEALTFVAADRVVHALLVLALVRSRSSTGPREAWIWQWNDCVLLSPRP